MKVGGSYQEGVACSPSLTASLVHRGKGLGAHQVGLVASCWGEPDVFRGLWTGVGAGAIVSSLAILGRCVVVQGGAQTG